MQESSRPLYARVGALGATALLAVSGGFIASPAIAAPATPEPDSNTVSEPASLAPTQETAGELPPGLPEAVLRDLGMTMEEFEAAGELGKKAADALPALQAIDGFTGVAIEDGKIVITGTGDELKALAEELGATLVEPAAEEGEEAAGDEAAPTEETTETPAVEAPGTPAPSASEAPSEETAATEPAAPTEPAPAAEVAKQSLPADVKAAVQTLRSDYIANVGVQGLKSIMWDGKKYVINVEPAASTFARVMAEVGESPAESLAAKYEGVDVVSSPGELTPVEDVFNGQGYATDANTLCSLGFSGFNRAGDPAVITAGHCTDDGEGVATTLTVPTSDQAGGAPEGTPQVMGSALGSFGFSQFGGAGNTPADQETKENIGTDIAVMDRINPELDLLPEVTHWQKASPEAPLDLAAETTKLTGTSEVVVGAAICKSGRTTGWTCGKVTSVGEFYVGGGNGLDDARGVWGFESLMEADGQAQGGDSGGPTVSGTNAVGINSAVGPRAGVEYTYSTSLADGLKYTDGYSVAFFVEKPSLTSVTDGTVQTDGVIRGTSTAPSVVLTRGGETTTLPVVDGAWSFTAPSTVPAGGQFRFSAQAVNGFNKSEVATFSVTVTEAPLAAPVITSPADGARVVDAVETINGTGSVGAEVTLELTGTRNVEEPEEGETAAAAVEPVELSETATVNADGTWEWTLDEALTYGTYTVEAIQDREGKEASPAAKSTFEVVVASPAITSIKEGQDFAEGSSPTVLSGTAVAGADVVAQFVTADGSPVAEGIATVVDANGNWTVSNLPALAPGAYKATAVQTREGVDSAPAAVSFTVTAPVAAPPAAPAPENTPAPETVPAPDNNGDGLPDTGASGLGILAGAGALLLAGGAGILLVNRRRRMQNS